MEKVRALCTWHANYINRHFKRLAYSQLRGQYNYFVLYLLCASLGETFVNLKCTVWQWCVCSWLCFVKMSICACIHVCVCVCVCMYVCLFIYVYGHLCVRKNVQHIWSIKMYLYCLWWVICICQKCVQTHTYSTYVCVRTCVLYVCVRVCIMRHMVYLDDRK